MTNTNSTPPPEKTAEERFYSLKEFLKLAGLSYTTYRKLRSEGKTPQEMRLSPRKILISSVGVAGWRTKLEQENSNSA